MNQALPPQPADDASTTEVDFPLAPYLETLYRWSEAQPWYPEAFRSAWVRYVEGVANAPPDLPDANDPDQHSRVLRFLAWFHLDCPVGVNETRTPLALFLTEHESDLTPEGREVYAGLTQTVYGAFKVFKQFRITWLEDLVHGVRYQLRAGPLGEELQAGDLVVGRLYPFEGAYEGDPDLHIGHLMEWGGEPRAVTPPEVEARYFSAVVPSKGGVMDVLDALLMQIDSPLSAEAVFEMMREAPSLDEWADALYGVPSHRLRFLHLRDRALFEELLQELWDTSGPLQEAQLGEVESTQLTRAARDFLRAVAEGNVPAVHALMDPSGLLPMYLELFGPANVKRLFDVASGAPSGHIRARHQLLPREGGIFTTLSWGAGTDKHAVGLVAAGQKDGRWLFTDVSLPEHPSPGLVVAFDKAQNLGWSDAPPGDAVEVHLRQAVMHVGYSVHDTIDLFRLWREFKAVAAPDLSQPSIWAAGLELADTRLRNEDVDVKILAKSYRVMPRAIEDAAREIEAALLARSEAEN
jgi:hypothetical protein